VKWFRFYSEAINSPKVQRLPGPMFKHWVNILCLANDHEPRGWLPDIEDVAFALRLNKVTAASVLGDLESQGFLDRQDDGSYRPHNWEKWQPKRDTPGSTRSADTRTVSKRTRKGHAHIQLVVPESEVQEGESVDTISSSSLSVSNSSSLSLKGRGSGRGRRKDARAPREIGKALLSEETEWCGDLQRRFPELDWSYESEKWLDHIEVKPPTGNYKNSFRGWLERSDGWRKEKVNGVARVVSQTNAYRSNGSVATATDKPSRWFGEEAD